MSIIRQLSLRSMKKNRTTTLVTLLGIIMSIALMTGLFLFANSLLGFMRDVQALRDGDSQVVLYDAQRDYLDSLPNQDLVEKRTLVPLIGVMKVDGEPGHFGVSSVVGYNPVLQNALPLKVDEGRLPEKPGEIVITSTVNTDPANVLQVGDKVTFNPQWTKSYDYISDDMEFRDQGITMEGTIVGITLRTPMGYPHFLPTYFVYQTEEEIAEASRVWAGYVLRDLTGDRLDAFTSGIDQHQAPFGITTLVEYYPNVPSHIRTYGFSFALVLAIIVGLAGISLIQNGFMISLTQRLRELSVLSSVGMTRRQKWQMSLTEGLTMFLIGLPLGLFFGTVAMIILFKVLTPLFQSLFETTSVIKLHWDAQTIAIICLLSFITLLIASFIPAFKTSRQTPLAGVRQQDDFAAEAKSLRSPKLVQKLFGFEGDLAWKNLKRNKRRYRGTLIALVLSLVLYLGLASLVHFANLSATVADTRGRDDITIFARSPESYEHRADFEALGKFEGIKDAKFSYVTYSHSQQPTGAVSDQISYEGENPIVQVEIVSFDQPMLDQLLEKWGVDPAQLGDGKAILINQFRQKEPDGRYIQEPVFENPPETLDVKLESPSGAVDQHFDIVKVVDEPLDNYDSWNPSVKLIVTQETLEELGAIGNINMNLRIIAEKRDHTELTKALMDKIGADHPDYSLSDYQGMYQKDRDFLTVAKILFFGFATIIALISLANIYNTIMSSLRFRRKEFAMLRSVGMEEASFRKMIRFESYFYAGKLLLYALPLGVGVSYLIYRYLIRTVEFTYRIPVLHFAIAALVVVLVLLLIMNLGSKNARRGNILETLKLEMDI